MNLKQINLYEPEIEICRRHICFSTAKELTIVASSMNRDLHKIKSRMDSNRLKFNSRKCKFGVLGELKSKVDVETFINSVKIENLILCMLCRRDRWEWKLTHI